MVSRKLRELASHWLMGGFLLRIWCAQDNLVVSSPQLSIPQEMLA
jgi:hypothetical protein